MRRVNGSGPQHLESPEARGMQVLILQVSNRYGESEAGRQWGFIER